MPIPYRKIGVLSPRLVCIRWKVVSIRDRSFARSVLARGGRRTLGQTCRATPLRCFDDFTLLVLHLCALDYKAQRFESEISTHAEAEYDDFPVEMTSIEQFQSSHLVPYRRRGSIISPNLHQNQNFLAKGRGTACSVGLRCKRGQLSARIDGCPGFRV
jgi:hypothetical protein